MPPSLIFIGDIMKMRDPIVLTSKLNIKVKIFEHEDGMMIVGDGNVSIEPGITTNVWYIKKKEEN